VTSPRGRVAIAAALAAGLVCVAASHPAHAQEAPPKSPLALPVRSAVVANDGRMVTLTVAFRDALDGDVVKKLTSGLPTVVATRGYLFREAGGDPIALTAKTCRVVYDLWDEVFRIQLAQAGATTSAVAINVEGVLRICAEARALPLAEPGLLRDGERYFVAALVEVNPLSAEMLERIRRWVTRPSGSAAIGPGDSLFGSFVGLFVTRVGDADRKLAFRTQPFAPPPPPPKSP
jgi:hypothetical protein